VWIQGAWLIGVAVVGALGGFLSGLIQVRSSQITLGEYQESMLKLWLRPLVGALVPLVVFILLSWQIVPGVKVDNPGSQILFAFLAGFSERYFLTLLRLDSTDGKQTPTRSGDPAHPQPQRPSDEKGASARARRD
jgi:hypothetical protein